MNPLAYIIGVPLGLWLSDRLHHAPEIYRREKKNHEQFMENRFGADRRKCQEYKEHCAIADAKGRQRRAEFRSKS